jgi:DNA-binding GntR family transcriptional regulator
LGTGELYTLMGVAPYGGRAMTKAEFAHEWIRDRILSGEFEPGQMLDQEALSGALGLSTTPLREAVRRLESEQLVVSRAHRDVVVAPLEYETLEEVFTVRLENEPLGTRLAATHATDQELRGIAELIAHPPETDVAMTLLRYNGAIHRRIYHASHNAVLIRVLDSLSDMVDRYRALALKRDPGKLATHRDHNEIMVALLAREPELAERLMREHVAYGFERMRADNPL